MELVNNRELSLVFVIFQYWNWILAPRIAEFPMFMRVSETSFGNPGGHVRKVSAQSPPNTMLSEPCGSAILAWPNRGSMQQFRGVLRLGKTNFHEGSINIPDLMQMRFQRLFQ